MKPHGWKETQSKKYLLPIKQLTCLESFWNTFSGETILSAFQFKIRHICSGQTGGRRIREEALATSLGTHLCISMLALMNFRFFLLLLLSITLLFTIQIDMPVSVDEAWTFYSPFFYS